MVKIEPSNLSFTCTVVYPVETSVFFVCAERPKKIFKNTILEKNFQNFKIMLIRE